MSADTADDTAEVVVECDLPDAPEKVWRALTEPALLEAWLLDGAPDVSCEVLEAEPERSVRYGWRDGGPVDSEVSFQITRTGDGGTHLRLVHSAVRPATEMRLRWAA